MRPVGTRAGPRWRRDQPNFAATADLADIGGLVGLQSVQRLFLDNNYIRTIENLGHLTQLSWLGA